MSSFWDSLGKTVDSLGGAAFAPIGAAIDTASHVFHGDTNFGDYVDTLAKHAQDSLDPLMNNDTLTGMGFGSVMHGLDVAYREGVSEPLSTAETMVGHVAYKPFTNWQDIFSGQKWQQAYDVAQHRSIGQSALLTHVGEWGSVFGKQVIADPLDQRAYQQIHAQHQFLTSASSGLTDFAARWYLDPGVVLGKAGAALNAARKGGEIGLAAHAAGINKILSGEVKAQHGFTPFSPFGSLKNSIKFASGNDLATRTAKLKDWWRTGADGAPMNSTQIFVGTDTFRASPNGRQLAGLVEDALKIQDKGVQDSQLNRILSVAYGDKEEALKATDELRQSAAISDELKNIAKGNVVDLKTSALGDEIMANPVLFADLQGQLDNMDAVTEAVDNHVRRLELLVGKAGDAGGLYNTVKEASGVSAKGRRAVGRELGHGLLRDGTLNTGRGIDKPAGYLAEQAARFAKRPVVESVFQKSQTSVPLRILTHTGTIAGKTALGYARMPQKFTDALRQVHFNGMANLHEWESAQTQLDAMMRKAGVEDNTRWGHLSDASKLVTEAEKQSLIERVEHDSIMALAVKHGIVPEAKAAAEANGENYGPKFLRDFITEVVQKGSNKRAVFMAPRSGRAYAATLYEDPLRARSSERIVDAAKAKLRADQKVVGMDENNIPITLTGPLLETQLANYVPLVDIDHIDTILGRHSGFFAQHAKAWANMKRDVTMWQNARQFAGDKFDKALQSGYAAMDHLTDAATRAMRVWKYSVLFRLGYPMRIVLDDHSRIWSQIGAAAFYGPNLSEAMSNAKYNIFDRRAQAKAALASLKSERDWLAPLVDDEAVAIWNARDADIRRFNERIDALTSAAERTSKKGPKYADAARRARAKAKQLRDGRDALQSLQDSPPQEIQARISEIEDMIQRGQKAIRKGIAKKHVGQRDVVLFDGTVARGAFGGEMGDAWRRKTSSNHMWEQNLAVGEEKMRRLLTDEGGYSLIAPSVNGEHKHLVAWADVLNHQFRQSSVAMHFVKDGDVEGFVRWLKEPGQKTLRERLVRYSNDPEDWGHRIEALVDDYLGSDAIRKAVQNGKVTPEQLKRLWPDVHTRPTIHSATVAHNLGTSRAARHMDSVMNRIMKMMSEDTTDHLTRHTYFSALYRSELNDMYAKEIAQLKGMGREFTQDDLRLLESAARKRALNGMRRTLFDIESHSNAAHMLRFISPFFAAHQEAVTRWWRIVSENPEILRRFQQTFDMPKKMGLVVDQNGNPVPDGKMVGSNQYLLLRLPEAWGGGPIDPSDPNFKGQAKWKISLNSFNLILQSGSPLNPGVGPLVSVPAEGLLHKLADHKELENLVRLINPYPSDSALGQLYPATIKRAYTLIRREHSGEFMYMWANNFQDELVQWREAHPGGVQPNKTEQANIWERAKKQTLLDAWLRLGQNFLSPFPANPGSRYEAVRAGWTKILQQMQAQGKDYNWAIDQFQSKYGEAFFPLTNSSSNNVANLPVTNRAVGAIKEYRGILNKVDPSLAGGIIGPVAGYTKGRVYSQAASTYLRNTTVAPGSSATYISTDDPQQQFIHGAVQEGWQKYSDMTASLQVMAQNQGLETWRQSTYLTALKDRAVSLLENQNPYWGQAYTEGISNPQAFQYTLKDLQTVVGDKKLASDPARTDIQTLGTYLQLRQMFADALAQRAAAGGASTMAAQANADLQAKFIYYFGKLEESNLDFQRYWADQVLYKDPFLQTTNPKLVAAEQQAAGR
ncbi:MAG TPA: hypothetical protein VFH56_14450 [Acidimicrobiales bacterium]|nr:hypothetical protein [Acidimicrobiales bacterium]